jgi:pimeloyl-ACP methyl ester carboxylesterase
MDAALNWYRAMGSGLVKGLGPITAPTLFVWSTEDPSLGRDAAEATVTLVTGPYCFEVLEGVGHWIPELAADAFNQLLLEQLASEG